MAQLETPTATIIGIGQYSLVVSGLINENASSWKYKVGQDGESFFITPDSNGVFFASGLIPTTSYSVYIQAVGDGEDYTDSEWSDAATAITGVEGQFFQWIANLKLSHDNMKKQNALIRGKITDLSGSVIPPSKISSCTFSAFKASDYPALKNNPLPITGFQGVSVPVSAFSSSLDSRGYNFNYVPIQTSNTLMETEGYYELRFKVSLTSGNPINLVLDSEVR